MTIKEIIEILSQFPTNATVYAYEGEQTGIVIINENRNEIGFIELIDEES